MANLFGDVTGGALAHLAAAMKGNTGRTVAYRQGTRSPTLTGWASETEIQVEQEGSVTVAKVFVWNFYAKDLTDNDIRPKSGDRIVETLNGLEVVYESMPIDDRTTVKDQLDTSSVITQVFTKRIRNG